METSLKTEIYGLIESIKPFDRTEANDQQAILDWINSGNPLFRTQKPDIPNKHLISYCLPFDPIRREILLVHHKQAQLMLPPGGHVEVNEDPFNTARRECEEELGTLLPISDKPLFLSQTTTIQEQSSHVDVCLWYLAYASSSQVFHFCQKEIDYLKWYTLEALPLNNSDKHLQRFASKLVYTGLPRIE